MRKRQISGPDQEDTASQSERSILWWSLGENEDGHSTIRCYLDENAREAKEPLVQLCLQLFEGINTDNLQRASTIPDAARVLVDMLTECDIAISKANVDSNLPDVNPFSTFYVRYAGDLDALDLGEETIPDTRNKGKGKETA
jgi:hypothetical protein